MKNTRVIQFQARELEVQEWPRDATGGARSRQVGTESPWAPLVRLLASRRGGGQASRPLEPGACER